ncbi:SpoIID/LytB domain-containing protein [Bacillota bacterium LX-D]|nr:SpoIID/LytB domain-containing protein [Bacillota bacterium LX-D]
MFKYKKPMLCLVSALFVSSLLLTACDNAAKKPGARNSQYTKEPTISLYVNEKGQTQKIKLEEYLKGVVAAEMEPTWPREALAAQAIIARTFTLKKIAQGGVEAHGTDASTDVKEFQAYDPARINQNVIAAVDSTRGMVATYKGNYINGWFFADAGGRTSASAAEGLAYTKEKTPYIHSVEDPGFKITVPENKAWKAVFPLDQVRAAVQKLTGQNIGENPTKASVVQKGPSGRAVKIKIGNAVVGAPALRLALGNEQMRSTLLTGLMIANGKLVVTGKGYGHGVGMSQWGARALAEQGKKASDIVHYYFRNIKIERMWK